MIAGSVPGDRRMRVRYPAIAAGTGSIPGGTGTGAAFARLGKIVHHLVSKTSNEHGCTQCIVLFSILSPWSYTSHFHKYLEVGLNNVSLGTAYKARSQTLTGECNIGIQLLPKSDRIFFHNMTVAAYLLSPAHYASS